jgi:hypothetical protein
MALSHHQRNRSCDLLFRFPGCSSNILSCGHYHCLPVTYSFVLYAVACFAQVPAVDWLATAGGISVIFG